MSSDGLYSGYQFAYAPIEHDYDKTTRMHEAAHRLLTQSSPWGQMIVLVREIMEVDKNKDRVEQYFLPICKILFQASEFTQESFAVLLSIHEARLRNDYDTIQKILKSNYAKIYNKNFLDVYLKFEPAQAAFQLCYKLVEFAMDTYLLEIETKHWESSEALYKFICNNRSLFFPDFRFEKLTDALVRYLNQPDLSEQTKYRVSLLDVISMAGLNNLVLQEDKSKYILSTFEELMKNVFQNEQSILKALSLVNKNIVITDTERDSALINYFEIPQMEYKYSPFQFSTEIFPLVNRLDVLRIFLYNDQINMVYISNRLKQFTMFCVYWNNLRSYIEVFDNEIIVPCTDYYMAKENDVFPFHRRVFYYIECHHDAFKEYLLELGSEEIPNIHFRKITDSTFAIFAQIKDNDILFGFQKTYALNLFIDDVFNGEYKYVQCESSMIDNIFYLKEEDDYCYGQVVQAMLQDNNPGNRIFLKDY